jgi:hypothetical protein
VIALGHGRFYCSVAVAVLALQSLVLVAQLGLQLWCVHYGERGPSGWMKVGQSSACARVVLGKYSDCAQFWLGRGFTDSASTRSLGSADGPGCGSAEQ